MLTTTPAQHSDVFAQVPTASTRRARVEMDPRNMALESLLSRLFPLGRADIWREPRNRSTHEWGRIKRVPFIMLELRYLKGKCLGYLWEWEQEEETWVRGRLC